MERLYTVEEACDALRVARQTLYKYMDRGVKGVKLSYVYVGGERRITQGGIDAFMQASMAAAQAERAKMDTQISASSSVAAIAG